MDELHEFMKKRPWLIWYVRDIEKLDDRSIVEHVLNYGDWNDVQEMFRIMGIERAAKIFRENAFRSRTNYYPEVARYFDAYFNAHAYVA
jgi:hypothetical protein